MIRDHLKAAELRAFRGAIRAAIAAKAPAWGLLGWCVCGSGDALEIEIKVSRAGRNKVPQSPTLQLPPELGGQLRLRVAFTLDPDAPPPSESFAEPSAPPVRVPVAPGAPILVGSGSNLRKGGIAAVLCIDGKLHLLTCGHIFYDSETVVLARQSARPIATLCRNYLSTQAPLDGAVCELLPEGLTLLAASQAAPTWLQGYLEPAPEDNNGYATFWPTHQAGVAPLDFPVNAYSASTSVLFSRGPYDDFIELEFGVIPGDSGSLLAKDHLYFGLCSGHVQSSWSYFTPIAAVLNRLAQDYKEVALWHPDSGIPNAMV